MFHLLPCQSQSLHTGCGAADGRWGSPAASGAGGLLAGIAELLQVLKLARVRVKQVKGCSHLKKRMGGKKEWEKGLRQLIYQRWLGRWYSQVYSFPFELYCLTGKLSALDFLRAIWESKLKTARNFFSVSDYMDCLLFHKHPLLYILFCVQMALGLGTVKRHGILLSLSLVFFSNVHIKVSPSIVHNWLKKQKGLRLYFQIWPQCLKRKISSQSGVPVNGSFPMNMGIWD